MLTSSEWLYAHLEDPNVVIVDTRPKVAYLYGHIPGSVSLVVDQLIKINEHGAHLAPEPEEASRLCGSLGIDSSKTVVVTGEVMDPSVARVAWTLEYLGHKNVKILDVGLTHWQSKGNPLVKSQKKIEPTQFVPNTRAEIRVEAQELQGLLGKSVILDARTPQEYFGGHIPGSILAPFTDGLGQGGLLFDSKESLANLFAQKMISKQDQVICYCMHGHRASSLFYQLKIAGYEQVRLYDGSFIDWYSRGLALE
ncbi:MAG: sulfurtransferase [Candidatus Nitrosotenuis sp.]